MADICRVNEKKELENIKKIYEELLECEEKKAFPEIEQILHLKKMIKEVEKFIWMRGR
jgi:hypothetical protein